MVSFHCQDERDRFSLRRFRDCEPPMSTKDAYHHGDLRRALLDESLKLIAEKGVEGLSLRKVAARVGVSHAAPYHHFADKTALIHALGQDGMALLDKQMAAAEKAAGDDPQARLLGIGTAYVSFAVQHPDYYAAFNAPEMRAVQADPGALHANSGYAENDADDTADAPEREPGDTWVRLLNAILACQASGLLPAGDPVILGVCLWSLVHGLAELWRTGPLSLLPQATEGVEPLTRQVLLAALGSMSANERDSHGR